MNTYFVGCLIFIPLVFAAWLVILHRRWWTRKTIRQLPHWPRINGTIRASSVQTRLVKPDRGRPYQVYSAQVVCAYEFQGTNYESISTALDWRASLEAQPVQELVQRYAVAQSVVVAVPPHAPAHALPLDWPPGGGPTLWVPIFGIGMSCVMFGILWAVNPFA
jgi:Protein of unknown function (DUF3592)